MTRTRYAVFVNPYNATQHVPGSTPDLVWGSPFPYPGFLICPGQKSCRRLFQCCLCALQNLPLTDTVPLPCRCGAVGIKLRSCFTPEASYVRSHRPKLLM